MHCRNISGSLRVVSIKKSFVIVPLVFSLQYFQILHNFLGDIDDWDNRNDLKETRLKGALSPNYKQICKHRRMSQLLTYCFLQFVWWPSAKPSTSNLVKSTYMGATVNNMGLVLFPCEEKGFSFKVKLSFRRKYENHVCYSSQEVQNYRFQRNLQTRSLQVKEILTSIDKKHKAQLL